MVAGRSLNRQQLHVELQVAFGRTVCEVLRHENREAVADAHLCDDDIPALDGPAFPHRERERASAGINDLAVGEHRLVLQRCCLAGSTDGPGSVLVNLEDLDGGNSGVAGGNDRAVRPIAF